MHQARIAGHICLDLLPELAAGIPTPGGLAESGRLQMRLGGCVANTGLALAALGAPVELVATVGDDLLGDAATTLLGSVSTAGTTLTRAPGQSTSYSIVIEPPGEDRRFLHHVGANESFDGSGVPVAGADLLHVGYPQLLPRLVDDDGAGLIELLARARAGGVTTSVDFATVDPHARSRPWPQIVRRWAPLIDVLTPSVDDLAPAFPRQPATAGPDTPVRVADELAEALVHAGVGVAMVTAGRAGLCLRTADATRLRAGGTVLAGLPDEWTNRQLCAPPPAVDQIQTTTGAGDIATAGLLFGLLAGFAPEQALQLAAAAAGLHVSGVAPLPPWATHSIYNDIATPIETQRVEADGWTATPSGILQGPVDKKGAS